MIVETLEEALFVRYILLLGTFLKSLTEEYLLFHKGFLFHDTLIFIYKFFACRAMWFKMTSLI